MGDQLGESVRGTLHYVPKAEFERVLKLPIGPVKKTRIFADLCRLNALYMIARAGSGHIGSSFSSLDIVSWIHLNELNTSREGRPPNLYFSSKGHDVPGLYAALTGLGKLDLDLIHRLRRVDGLPGHPDTSTRGVAANTGSLGMGISKAKGMVIANRMRGIDQRIFVLTGDGELQEGQIWESLASAANFGMHELTVIVDHNKLQSDTFVSKVSDLGDLEGKLLSFGWHVERCDGHDLDAVASVIARVTKVRDKPQVIIADTIKGRGVSFMEHTAMAPYEERYRFHSGAPDADSYARAVEEIVAAIDRQLQAVNAAPLSLETAVAHDRPASARPQRLVDAYSRALIDQACRNPQIVALDADLMLDTGLIPFRQAFPERFFECGIAEQDMVSQAGGMALRGLLPVVHSFACFLSARPNEQIYNNATERTKIIYVGSLAGIVPGGPGHSHQAVRDIAALAAVPGLVMIEPATEHAVELAVDYCARRISESSYIRLVSVPWEIPFELPGGYRFEEGRGVTLREGRDAVIFAYGPVMLSQAWRAAEILAEQRGVRLKVVELPWLNRIDQVWLRDSVSGCPHVFTLDNHYITGGQGEMIGAALAETGALNGARFTRFGIRGLQACGTNDEVLRAHGLDAASLAASIWQALHSRPAGHV